MYQKKDRVWQNNLEAEKDFDREKDKQGGILSGEKGKWGEIFVEEGHQGGLHSCNALE